MKMPIFARRARYFLIFLAFFFLALSVKTTWAGAFAKRPQRHYYKVTFSVGEEFFRAAIISKSAMAYVRTAYFEEAPFKFPVGIVVRGQNLNAPWSWHLRPDTIHFTEMATEYCDAQLPYIEKNLTQWIRENHYYCPWRAKIVSALECVNNHCHQLRPR